MTSRPKVSDAGDFTPPARRRAVDLDIGGHRLAGEWTEAESSPGDDAGSSSTPLVLLHEGLGSIALWRRKAVDVAAFLAAATGRPVFAYDRLGFGGSDPLPGPRAVDYLHDEAERLLPAVLDAAGIERAALVGHSDGATIALLAAAALPDRVAAAVSEAAHVIVEPETLAGIRRARAAFHAANSRLRAGLERAHGDKTETTFANWADLWLTPDFARFDMTGRLGAVTCPVLALQGDGDEYGTPRQLALIEAGVAGPVETWLVPECRHVPHHQAPAAVLPRIAAFLRAVATADAGDI
ncbi:MAG: alpha/beta hydrolase [Azospirillaceae bacterium]